MQENKTLFDRILALATGAIAFALLTVWAFPGLHPYVWNDVAVGAGLLPQTDMLPGFGAILSHAVFALLPFETALTVNVIVAKALMAFCGVMVFDAMTGLMVLVSGMGARDWRRRRLAIRLAAFVGALAFACADPIWHAAQGLTASTVVVFLAVLTFALLVRMLRTASFGLAVATLFSAGLLCAETPLGWVELALGLGLTFRYLAQPQTDEWKDFLDPVAMQRTKWSVTFVFIASFIIGILLEVGAFALLDGMRATGSTYGDLPVRYAQAYLGLVTSSMSVTGICLFAFAVLVPFVLSSVLVNPATDEDRYLSFKFSIIFFLTGLIAFLQLSPFEFTWFWAIAPDAVSSKQIVVFSSLLSALTLVWSLYVLGVEIFCRDYNHIENVMYQSYSDDATETRPGHEDVVSVKLTLGRLSMTVVPLVLLALILPGRKLPNDRALLATVYDFVRETLDETAGVRYLFTDGSYDAALRIEATRRDQALVPVSVMSGASRREAYVRQLGTENFEDRMTLETGASEALRTWVMAKSERLNEVAAQVAFELFRVNRKLEPLVYGLLVRPSGGDAKAAAESVERCHALADRIVALHDTGVWRHAKDVWLKDRFLFAQFRLAVMSRLRAINLDAQKKVKESIAEIAYSDRLNACNPSLVKILRRMDWVRRQSGEALTPREGLEVAMKRADFVMARRYAMPVLMADKDDPNANFAVGMSYYAEEQYGKAEEYLKRVLKRSPKEAAVYNNIALICLKTRRLEEAETNARKANELFPNSPEVLDTLRQIEKAKAARKTPLRK